MRQIEKAATMIAGHHGRAHHQRGDLANRHADMTGGADAISGQSHAFFASATQLVIGEEFFGGDLFSERLGFGSFVRLSQFQVLEKEQLFNDFIHRVGVIALGMPVGLTVS